MHIVESKWCCSFGIWLVLLKTATSSSVLFPADDRHNDRHDVFFFFFMAEQNLVVYMVYIFLPNLSMDGHLG